MAVRLVQLNLYPIKGCRGIALTAAELASTGLEFDEVGDREWVVSDADGEFLSQRELPKMALIETRIEHGLLTLKAPGMLRLDVPLESEGDVVKVRVWNDTLAAVTQGDLTDAWFSSFLGQPCRLLRFDPEARRLANKTWTDGAEVPYKFADAFPLLIASLASLADVNERLRGAGQAAIGMERFRPNLVFDGDDSLRAYEEDYVREFRRDGVVLRNVKPCARCTVPGVDPSTGVASNVVPDLLASYRQRTVEARDNPSRSLDGVMFGINAIVTAGAGSTLRVGDEFELELDL